MYVYYARAQCNESASGWTLAGWRSGGLASQLLIFQLFRTSPKSAVLAVTPMGDFAPVKDHEIPLEEAYAKLKALGQAARLLRAE